MLDAILSARCSVTGAVDAVVVCRRRRRRESLLVRGHGVVDRLLRRGGGHVVGRLRDRGGRVRRRFVGRQLLQLVLGHRDRNLRLGVLTRLR